jgi:hypothetical protein
LRPSSARRCTEKAPGLRDYTATLVACYERVTTEPQDGVLSVSARRERGVGRAVGFVSYAALLVGGVVVLVVAVYLLARRWL